MLANMGRMLWCFSILSLTVLGCSNAVDPDPESTTSSAFIFAPGSDFVDVTVGELFIFRISHQTDPVFSVAWQLNGRDVGLGPRYGYLPKTLGLDTLTARATWKDDTEQRRWLIKAVADSTTTVTFEPTQYFFELTVGETVRFEVMSSRPDRTGYRWEMNRQVVAETASYLFTASVPGRDTLRATVTTPSYTESQNWQVQSYAPGQLRPLRPLGAAVVVGNQPASLVVSWHPPELRGDAIVAYAVAVSYIGAIDETNWHQADIMAEVPVVAGFDTYSAAVSDSASGLRPGAHAWLAIASLNSYGVTCAAPPNLEVDITEPWWIDGTVTDEMGMPVVDALVHDPDLTPTARTGSDGHYRVGPFFNTSAVRLHTETPDTKNPDGAPGSWYDVVAETQVFGGPAHWDFLLIGRFGLTSPCSNYDGDFLVFLRSLTRTTWPTDLRQNLQLYKWDSYPVTAWIPDFISPNGHDFGALCRQTVAWWNEAMGVEYLTLVADRAEARIVFRFGDDEPGFLGKVKILEPPGSGYVMGEVVPELVEVYLLDELTPPQLVQEISLHELGHALGLSGHAACRDGNYLMYLLPSGMLDNGVESAIHADEKRALSAVRHLPQGYDMGSVEKSSK